MYIIREIDHTADICIEIKATSIEEIFIVASEFLFDTLCDLNKIKENSKFVINEEANNYDDLLFNFLKKALEMFYADGVVIKKIVSINILKKKEKIVLSILAIGEKIELESINRDIYKAEIKAVTYHKLKIKKIGKYYCTYIIFDV